ncbi:MAG TPA: ABC transporter substrate-binding protein [Nocardioides sp.]|uniref:ABC transporter substrate-binding protein n=1 Tax=Nocardioides sp. TaxID=35761 RepID=UPI002E3263DA|nr:ABC transporter substrate-binding protein [Nocardioides sp.]HEX5088832.1 ABC transporter substrate-binding protein [Nocardioides sp.]
MPRVAVRPRAVRVLCLVTGAALALGLAACGSQLDPDQVADANGGTAANLQAGGDVVPGAGSGSGTTTTGGGTTTSGGTSAASGTPAAGGTGTTGSTGGGSSTAGGGGDAASSGGGHGGGGHGGPGGAPVSCDGFKTGPGVTDSEITIGNSSDISGPVPGLFESSQDAVKAYVAYFNSTSDICGRKLRLVTYDSRTDAGADQQNYAKGCDEVFAMVGSMSAFDSGGASTAQSCGLPDIRSASVTKDRNDCTTCFPAQSIDTGEFENAPAEFVKKNYPQDVGHAAMLYINAGAGAENGPVEASAMTKQGLHFDVVQGIDVSEFNYAPYAQALKDKGVKVVFWVGNEQYSVRLAQAMQQVGYKPDLYLRDPTDYVPDFVSSGGSAVDGTVVFLNFVPFEEAGSNQEMQLYLSWLQQVSPGADPTMFGVFSWSAAKLFVEKAAGLGGGLDRATLVDALKKTDNWTAGGMTAPQHVGSKRTGDCWRFIQLDSGVWKPVGSAKYTCAGTTNGG